MFHYTDEQIFTVRTFYFSIVEGFEYDFLFIMYVDEIIIVVFSLIAL